MSSSCEELRDFLLQPYGRMAPSGPQKLLGVLVLKSRVITHYYVMPAGFPKKAVNGVLLHPVPISIVVTDCETEKPKAKKTQLNRLFIVSCHSHKLQPLLHKKMKITTN